MSDSICPGSKGRSRLPSCTRSVYPLSSIPLTGSTVSGEGTVLRTFPLCFDGIDGYDRNTTRDPETGDCYTI